MILYRWDEDILSGEQDAIVNPVNCMGTCGAGLAKQFQFAYPEEGKIYREACREGRLTPGGILAVPMVEDSTRHIIYAATKGDWRFNSTYKAVEQILDNLSVFAYNMDLKSIAIPKLGCGLGKLEWSVVKEMIEVTFHNTVVLVEVYQ